MSRSNFLASRAILTTASVVSLVLGSANALAVDYTTVGDASINRADNWLTDPANPQTPNNGDNLIFGDNNHIINFAGGADKHFSITNSKIESVISVDDKAKYVISAINGTEGVGIILTDDNANLEITNTNNLVNDVILAEGATLTVRNGNIRSIEGTNHTSILIIDGNSTVKGSITELNSIQISNGGHLTLGDNADVTQLRFTGEGALTLADKTLTGDINFNGNNATLIVDGGNITGAITTGGNGVGDIIWKTGKLYGGVGAHAAAFRSLAVGETGNVQSNGNIFANTVNAVGNRFVLNKGDSLNGDLNINAGEVIAISGDITGDITGAGTLQISVAPDAANFRARSINTSGTIKFTYAGNIDRNYTTTGRVIIGQNITLAGGGTLNAGDLEVAAGKTFAVRHGAIHNIRGNLTLAERATIDLSQETITVTGDVNANGALTIKAKIDTTLGASSGRLIATNTNIDGMNVTIEIDPTSIFGVGGAIQLIDNVIGAPVYNILNVPKGTNMVGGVLNIAAPVVPDSAAAGVVPTAIVTAQVAIIPTKSELTFTENQAIVKTVLTLEDKKAVVESLIQEKAVNAEQKAFFDEPEKHRGQAQEFIEQVQMTVVNGDLKAAKEAIHRVSSTSSQVAATRTLNTVTRSATNVIAAHLGQSMVPMSLDANFAPEAVGVSSGSEDEVFRSGVWVQGFGGKSTQKTTKNIAGFDSSLLGGVVGVDTLVADNLRLGIAGVHANSRIKMRSPNDGDKTNAKSWLFSIYGSYEIDENWYTKAIASLGKTSVNVYDWQTNGVASGTAKGKYQSCGASIDLDLGYRHMLTNNIMLTPEVGIRANMFKDNGYKEAGGLFNREISKKSGSNYAASLGFSLSTNYAANDMLITPSVHAKVIQELGGKYPSVRAKLDGQNGEFVSKDKPLNKTSFNLGADLVMKSGILEFGVGYDANISKKFISHSGSIKLRANF